MGFPLHLFLADVDENFICVICHDVVESPRSGCSQGHMFCAQCIDSWISLTKNGCPTCPVDREPLPPDKLISLKPVQNVIMNLQVCCKNANQASEKPARDQEVSDSNQASEKPARDQEVSDSEPSAKKQRISATRSASAESCMWNGKLSELRAHREVCPHVIVECSNSEVGCKRKVPRKDLSEHEQICGFREVACEHCGDTMPAIQMGDHLEECEEMQVECGNGCGYHCARKEEQAHQNSDCPLQEIDCPFRDLGCNHRFARKDEKQHHSDFSAQHVCMVGQTVTSLKSELASMSDRLEHEKVEAEQQHITRIAWSIEEFSVKRNMRATQCSKIVTLGDSGLKFRLQLQFVEDGTISLYFISVRESAACSEDPRCSPSVPGSIRWLTHAPAYLHGNRFPVILSGSHMLVKNVNIGVRPIRQQIAQAVVLRAQEPIDVQTDRVFRLFIYSGSQGDNSEVHEGGSLGWPIFMQPHNSLPEKGFVHRDTLTIEGAICVERKGGASRPYLL